MPIRRKGSIPKDDPGKCNTRQKRVIKEDATKLPSDANNSLSKKLRSSPRSTTPSSLYDFMGDSPQHETTNKDTDKKSKKSSERKPKKNGQTKEKKKTNNCKKIKDATPSSVATPKARKTVLRSISGINNHDNRKNSKPKQTVKSIKSISQPNLDDISPIVVIKSNNKKKVSTPALKKGNKKSVDSEKRELRSARKSKSVETPTVSFIESVDEQNDSAIFVSPRKTMPRFSTGTTSTPAVLNIKKTRKPSKNALLKLRAKDTSTPNEVRPKREFTSIKSSVSQLSPVQRIDTPTSDYGSMDSFVTPSPPQPKKERKKRGYSPTPAFSLDDDFGEGLSLNKSVDKSYKRSKKKYTTGKYTTAKIDEWADKVNSEMEDIENFELSVEG